MSSINIILAVNKSSMIYTLMVVFLIPYFANFNILSFHQKFSIFTYWPSVVYVSDQNRCYQHGMAVG